MTRTQLTRNLKIIFFALSFLTLRGVSMAAPAPRVILFLGDSITAGYGLDPSQAFPALIQREDRRAAVEFQSHQRRSKR